MNLPSPVLPSLIQKALIGTVQKVEYLNTLTEYNAGWVLRHSAGVKNRKPSHLNLRNYVIQAKSDHSEIGHSRNLLRATAVSFSETETTPIHRVAEENLPCPPKLSSKWPHKNKPVC